MIRDSLPDATTPIPICVGVIVGVFGIQGNILVKSYTHDPFDMARYGVLFDKNGRTYSITPVRIHRTHHLICRIQGVTDRNQAEALRGTELWVQRENLPILGDQEYYFEDLKDMDLYDVKDRKIGVVKTVEDYGGGAFLDIDGFDGHSTLPFHRESILSVDSAARRMTIDTQFLLLSKPSRNQQQAS
jgi:16S rRNA processing protein RimM